MLHAVQTTWPLKLVLCAPACISGRAECFLADAWERLRLLCSQNCEAQLYNFGDVVCCAAQLGSKRLIVCDAGEGVRAVRRARTVIGQSRGQGFDAVLHVWLQGHGVRA